MFLSQLKVIFSFLILTAALTTVCQAQSSDPNSPSTTPTTEYPPPVSVQQPAVRPRPPLDPNPESSSFFGEPENLDVLRARRDTANTEDEPVLEDIRSVLDAPTKKKVTPAKSDSKKSGAKKSSGKKSTAKKSQPKNLNPDDPDIDIEKRMYREYMKNAADPTPTEGWSQAIAGREAEVYIVQKGDTLWTISETLFGDAFFWPKIWAINRQGILNPHFILPGMKVRFYPGNPDNEPTLAVGEEDSNLMADGNSEDGPDDDEDSDDDSSDDGFDDLADNTDGPSTGAQDSGKENKVFKISSRRPTGIPPSLPLYRSDLYFTDPPKVEIDAIPPQPAISTKRTFDFIITDRLVVSDVKFLSTDKDPHNCMPGEMLRNFEFIRKNPSEFYEGLEQIRDFTVDKKVYYIYKRVVRMKYSEPGNLRIFDCRSSLTTDIAVIPSAVITSLKTKATNTLPPVIVTPVENALTIGPDFPIVINLGNKSAQIGETVLLNSSRLNVLSARAKIIDVYGSLALAFVERMDHIVEVGDSVIVK